MAEGCLKKCIGKLSVPHYLSVYPHSTSCHNLSANLPFLNEDDVLSEVSNFYKPFPFKVTYPSPFLPPVELTRSEINGCDPCWDLVNEKKNWENCREVLIKSCKQNVTSENIPDFSKKKCMKLPLNFTLLAEHLQNDPDPHFNGSYNWYYSGSNIETIDIGGKLYLIRPDNRNYGNLILTALQYDDGLNAELSDSYVISTSSSKPVYQISSQRGNFAIRLKNSCSYFGVNDSNTIKVGIYKTVKSKYPVTGLALNPVDAGGFCTISAKREINIWNASSKGPLESGVLVKEAISTDKWGNIYYITGNTLLVCDRDDIYLIDTRVGVGKPQGIWLTGGLSELCEDICSAALGSCDLHYIVTSHQIFGLDLRYGFRQRWTHGLPNSPSAVKVMRQSVLGDMVFVSSQHSGNIAAIENRMNEADCPVSRVLPYTLPTLRESFHAARCRGLCLSNIMGARFTSCITGMCLVKDKEDITLFTHTSLGDIFKQKLLKKQENLRDDYFSPEQFEKFPEWENECRQMMDTSKLECIVSGVTDASHIIETVADSEVVYDRNVCLNEDNMKRPGWRIPKRRLMRYCDYLAPKLLEAWNIQDEEEWDSLPDSEEENQVINGSAVVNDDDYDFYEKVTHWFENYTVENDDHNKSIEVETKEEVESVDDPE